MEKKEQEIDLGEIFFLLVSKLKFIILLSIIGALCGFVVTKFFLPVKYTSSISIYVNNSGSANSQSNGTATTADLTAAQTLASTYIVILSDDLVYDELSELLLQSYSVSELEKYFSISYSEGEPYISSGQLSSLVTISTVDDTEVISIQSETENAQLSADICTDIASIAPDILTRVTQAGSVETIGTAKIPSQPSSPNNKKNVMLGFLCGMFLAVAVVVISHLIDNRIKNSEDFKKHFNDLPVLAEIPDMSEDARGGSDYVYSYK